MAKTKRQIVAEKMSILIDKIFKDRFEGYMSIADIAFKYNYSEDNVRKLLKRHPDYDEARKQQVLTRVKERDLKIDSQAPESATYQQVSRSFALDMIELKRKLLTMNEEEIDREMTAEFLASVKGSRMALGMLQEKAIAIASELQSTPDSLVAIERIHSSISKNAVDIDKIMLEAKKLNMLRPVVDANMIPGPRDTPVNQTPVDDDLRGMFKD